MKSAYHHPALRETLLEEGRRLLVERGLEAVTLRELARRAGVSHAAPHRHFPDRDALLRALTARGFEELTDALDSAERIDGLEARLTFYATRHVRFAIDNGPLMQLMFSAKPSAATAEDTAEPAVPQAVQRFFALGARLLGDDVEGPVGPLAFVVAGTLEGIGSLAAAGRLPADRIDEVVRAAVAVLLPAVREQLDRTP